MPTEPSPLGRLHQILLAAVPAGRQEIARGLAAEAAALPAGLERRRWLRSAYFHAIREGRMTWIRMAISGANAVFILWITYNAIDSHFAATAPELAAYISLVVLLAATILTITPWTQLRSIVRLSGLPSPGSRRLH